ncbi:MAG: regulatory protein RecX [Halanaerobium sp.]|nr:regulatory protein RecX [Halanaerobium sp.]
MEESREQAKKYVLELLSYRQRSRQEIITRLTKKGFDRDLARQTCEYLAQRGYIDEEKLVRDWIHDGVNLKRKGPRKLYYELKSKGVPDGIIAEGLDEYYPEEEQLQACKETAEKWLKKRGLDLEKAARLKLKKYLYRRGFYGSIIDQVVGELGTDWQELRSKI